MSVPYLGEIRIFAFQYEPDNWASCDGRELEIRRYQELYSLLGTTYGGDGQTTFGLPDLRGRCAMHRGRDHRLGDKIGSETEKLTVGEMAKHSHAVQANSLFATSGDPKGNVLAQVQPTTSDLYGRVDGRSRVSMSPSAIGQTGGSGGHNNMQPFQTVGYCIAIKGIFPPRNRGEDHGDTNFR